MANTKDLFQKITETVLSNWTALKLAVDHGMGSREKAEEFCAYMTEVFYMNEGLDSEDIAAELEEYMDDAFQTELQDDSVADVAKELLRFHKYCIDGNESTALAELAKLPPLAPWILGKRTAKEDRRQQAADETKSNDGVERMEEEAEDEVEDDGWTEVKTRRQK